MSDLYNRIDSEHSPLQNLMLRLPGFRGYQENSDRRTADRLIRDHIVAALKTQVGALVQAEKTVLNNPGGLAFMSSLHEAQSKLQILIDRINAAAPGYAGFYDAIKIGPVELQKLYDFDAALIDYVDKFKEKIAAVQTAATTKEGLEPAIAALDSLTIEANTAYGQRENVITGVR